MNETTTNATTAYGDESVRMAGNPPFYMLGVCMLEDTDSIDFEKLAKMMPPESKKLHWRDMSQGLQRKSLELIAEINRVDMVVIASPLNGKKQERARRKCLEALLPKLEERGIEDFVLESRGATSDKLDISYVKYAKGSKLVKSISISHATGFEEPKLWIPDQIIGAMGDYMTQTSNWSHWKQEWEAISSQIEQVNVSF